MTKTLPLFPITRWLLDAAQIICAVVAGIFVIALGGIGVTAVKADHFGIPAIIEGVARSDALTLGALAVAGGLVGLVLLFFIFRALAAIVVTAIADDPFIDENARRLSRIGWLLVGLISLQAVLRIATHPLVERMESHLKDGGNVGVFDSDLSPVSILVILLVFVLAQIFRRGAAMRSELEGTI